MRKTRGISIISMIWVLFVVSTALAILFATYLRPANGATFVIEKATDAAIADTANILRASPSVNVKVITYMAIWDYDGMEPHLDRANAVVARLNFLGISNSRIELNFANKKGLQLEPYDVKTGPNKIPAEDGVYLLLTY
jgi:hypothetical protein